MFIVKLSGGLGNQMFQYAFGKNLSIEKNEDVYFDNYMLKISSNPHENVGLLNIFPIDLKIAAHKNVKKLAKRRFSKITKVFRKLFSDITPETHIFEKNVKKYNIAKINSPAYLDGVWGNYKYFKKYKEIIKSDFTFPDITEKHNIVFQNEINKHINSVSVHIRRGDYVSNPKTTIFHGVIPIEYYQKSIKCISDNTENPHFFFFSDDVKWVKKNFNLENMTIIQGNNKKKAFRDMQLMSMCKHHIIANSSFSWWGAWLGKSDGITIGPRRWFVNEPNRPSFFPPDWIDF